MNTQETGEIAVSPSKIIPLLSSKYTNSEKPNDIGTAREKKSGLAGFSVVAGIPILTQGTWANSLIMKEIASYTVG